MKILLTLIFAFTIVFSLFTERQEEPTSSSCSISFFDETGVNVFWTSYPKGANLYVATYRLDNLTTKEVLFSSTEYSIPDDGNIYLYGFFEPDLNSRNAYRMSGVVCVAYFNGYHETQNAIFPSFINIENYIPVLIKMLFGR